jgi:hypothetical protein
MRITSLSLLMAGCQPGLLCQPGATAVDGACVPVEAPDTDTDGTVDTDVPEDDLDVGDLIVEAQPCSPLPTGDRLDLLGGCADGACAQSGFSEVAKTLGRPQSCGPGSYDDLIDCRWSSGVGATVIDSNGDGEPNDDDYVYYLRLAVPWGGSDATGLGLGISPGCFVEVLGSPTTVTLQSTEGADDPWVSYAYWSSVRVVIQDSAGGKDPYTPDGRVDVMYLYGPE